MCYVRDFGSQNHPKTSGRSLLSQYCVSYDGKQWRRCSDKSMPNRTWVSFAVLEKIYIFSFELLLIKMLKVELKLTSRVANEYNRVLSLSVPVPVCSQVWVFSRATKQLQAKNEGCTSRLVRCLRVSYSVVTNGRLFNLVTIEYMRLCC